MTTKFIPGQMYKDREGREYMFVGYAPNAHKEAQTIFTMGKTIATRDLLGRSVLLEYDVLTTKDVWVNAYLVAGNVECGILTYSSEQEARENFTGAGLRHKHYLGPQKITVEV